MRIFATIILLGLLAVLSGTLAHAQLVPDALSLIASPSSPSPGQTVTVQAATPTFDKNAAFFSWSINGKVRSDLSGAGKDLITFVADTVGSQTRVAVDISRSGSEGRSVSLTIVTSDLSLPWFAETYVPKWYKGKALPVVDSVVRVVAIPQVVLGGGTVRPEDLIYQWGLDDEENALSGIGQRVFRVKVSDLPGASHHVQVTVEDQGKRIQKSGELFIVPIAGPRVTVYEVSPLGGVNPRVAVSVISTNKRGLMDFSVEPFFFSASTRKLLSYKWSVGGSGVRGAPTNPNLITLNTEGLAPGEIPVSVSVDDQDEIVPQAIKAFSLLLQ